MRPVKRASRPRRSLLARHRGAPDVRAGLARGSVGFGGCGMWEAAVVAQIDPPTDAIVGDWLTVPDVAGQLCLPVSRDQRLLRVRSLPAVQFTGGESALPARFLDGDQVIHGLGGTLTLLLDCGFPD